MSTFQCGSYVAVKCIHCQAIHTYKRFCKTAGCPQPGCAQARARHHVRKMMCTDFDFKSPFLFITLTARNNSREEMDNKLFRQARIKQIKIFMERNGFTKWVVGHECTYNPDERWTQRYHYHHHCIVQYDKETNNPDLDSFRSIWMDILGQYVEPIHGVQTSMVAFLNAKKVVRYMCKYISKDEDTYYWPKGFQSFQRHGGTCAREIDYEFEQTALVDTESVEDWEKAVFIWGKNGNNLCPQNANPQNKKIAFSCLSWKKGQKIKGKKPEDVLIPTDQTRLDGKKVEFIESKRIVISKSVKITIQIDKSGHTKVIKTCVNCATRFREDKYSRDTYLELLRIDPEEFHEFGQRMSALATKIA